LNERRGKSSQTSGRLNKLDRGIERAIKMLKRKLASEGVLRELKMRRHYMKPSVKRRKKQAEAARRRRKRAKVEALAPKTA